MSKTEKKEKTIGFVFGFKESTHLRSDEGDKIIINTKSGVSDKYPEKYKSKKDFWCEEIKEGQVSNIYISPEDINAGFEKELISFKDDPEFVEEYYNNERYLLTFPLKKEDFMVLMAMYRSQMYVYINERWESEQVFEDVMNKLGNDNIKDKELLKRKTPVEMLREYMEVKSFLYEKSLEILHSDVENPDKVTEDNLPQMKEELNSFKSLKKKM